MKPSEGRRGKKVRFLVATEPGSDVFLAGTFNKWKPGQCRMRADRGTGVFETTLTLPPGRYEYKFVINGRWQEDPVSAERVPNGQGSCNSVVIV